MPAIIHLTPIKAAYFECPEITVEEGDVHVVSVNSIEQGQSFADTLLGLESPLDGEVTLFGKAIYNLSEKARLSLLQEVSHVNGGLVSNLKVWENLLLPAQYHNRVSNSEAEQRLLEALDVLDNSELWRTTRLAALPDTLSPLASRIAGMLQAAVTRPRLVVGEFLLNDLEQAPMARLIRLLSWMKDQEPKMAFVFIHLGPFHVEHLSLKPLGHLGMVTLENGIHAISENH